MSADFNPHSQDAILATLLEHSKATREDMTDLKATLKAHRDEIDTLKKDKHTARGAITGIALLAPAAWDYVKARMGS